MYNLAIYKGYNPSLMIVYSLISLIIVFLLVLFNYKKDNEYIKKQIKIIAIIVWILEIIKILLNAFVFKETALNEFVPLYYCSLFLYFLIPTFSKNEKILDRTYGLLKYYGLVPALSFLLFPITALGYHEFISFPSLHSMFYHIMIIYVSLILTIKKIHTYKKYDFIFFIVINLSFCILTYIFNLIFKTNIMFINEADTTNIFLSTIGSIVGIFYPFVIGIGQTLGSFIISFGLEKIINKVTKKQ